MEHINALHGQNTEFLMLNLTLLVVTTMCELEQELREWHCGTDVFSMMLIRYSTVPGIDETKMHVASTL